MKWVVDDHMTKVMLEDFVAGMDAKGPKPLPHLTELISCLTKSYYNRYDPLPINPQTALIFVMGIGLEEALLRPHKERKAVYLDHIARGEVPKQFVYNEEWECENCAYLIICQAKQSIEDLRAKEVK